MDKSKIFTENYKNTHEYDKYDEPWYRFFRVFSALEKVIPEIHKEKNWLDLGCHQGQFVSLLIDKYNIKVTGIDDWNESLAKSNFFGQIQETSSCRYFQRNLEINFDIDEKFDFISALEVVEHMIDTDKFLYNCWLHLNEGGHLILSTPNINSLRNRTIVPLGKYPTQMEYKNIIHHVRLYNVPCLKKHLIEHKFKIKMVLGVNFLPLKYSRFPISRKISENLAIKFPQLCGNIIVICQK